MDRHASLPDNACHGVPPGVVVVSPLVKEGTLHEVGPSLVNFRATLALGLGGGVHPKGPLEAGSVLSFGEGCGKPWTKSPSHCVRLCH